MVSQPIENLFDGDLPVFEQKSRHTDFPTWSAREFASWLGYDDFAKFQKVLAKSQEILLSLSIDITEHFNQEITQERGRPRKDIRLTRFACYLATMCSDSKKPIVAKALVYFARFSEECQRYMDDSEQVNRVLTRREISKHERSLSSTAKKAGVEDYGLFRNAGYRGLYSKNLDDLKKLKGVPEGACLLDYMGSEELAANLFQNTQTEAKIKSEGIRGQKHLERTAEEVGKTVRDAMWKINQKRPEDLPIQEDIKGVKKGLKRSAIVLKNGSIRDAKELPAPEPFIEPPDEE